MLNGSRCPDRDTFDRLRLGRLPVEDMEALAQHLERCERCVAVVQALQLADPLVPLLQTQARSDVRPEQGLVERLIHELKDLQPSASDFHTIESPPTGGRPAPPREPAAAERYDFLAPPKLPDELGRLGPFRVLKVLGAGGMGIVFQAQDPQLERMVALKVMKPALAAGPSARQRFLREARATARIKHDHIVTIYQVYDEPSGPYLAMELLRGETLNDRVKREGKLPVAEVVRIGREIAEGLAAAHEQNLIHRDIKPSNIWLETSYLTPSPEESRWDEGGRVKILDFGLARASSDDAARDGSLAPLAVSAADAPLTQHGLVVGTPAYMAPEQARGAPLDHRCDLFSLGSVMYRMATGEPPFKGETTMAMLISLATDPPQPPREINPNLPPELADLILRLLAKDREQRPATAQAVVRMLETLEAQLDLHDEPVWFPVGRTGMTPPSTPTPRPAPPTPPVSPPRPKADNGPSLAPSRGFFGWLHGLVRNHFMLPKLPGTSPATPSAAGGPPGSNPAVDPDTLLPRERTGLRSEAQARRPLRRRRPRRPEAPELPEDTQLEPEADEKPPVPPPTKRRLWPIVLAVLLGGVLGNLFAPALLRYFADEGQLALQAGLTDLKVVVEKDGKPVANLDARTPSVTLPAGAYNVRLDDDREDLSVSAYSVRVPRGGRSVVEILRKPVPETKAFATHTGPVSGVAYSPDGRYFLTCSGGPAGERFVRLWEIASGQEIHRLEGHTANAQCVAFAPNGRQALSGAADRSVRLWDVVTGNPIRTFWESHRAPVRDVAFRPDGRRALSGSEDGTLRVWDVERGNELRRFEVPIAPVALAAALMAPDCWSRMNWLTRPGAVTIRSVAFSPDGSRVLAGAEDGTVHLWEVEPERYLGFFLLGAGPVTSVAFAPDGKAIAAGGGAVALWHLDPESGKPDFRQKPGAVRAVAFTRDGRSLLVAERGPVRLLDVNTGDVQHRLEQPSGGAASLSVSPQGTRVLVGSDEGTTWLQKLPTPAGER
jgi:serine/threonine protein kinase/WD40 repeat protein